MNTTLPAPRELTRHDEMRAELLRSLDTDRRWQHPAVLATAAASVLTVGVGVTTWQLSGDPGPRLERTAPGDAAKPPIPGLSAEERAAIERGCSESANQAATYINKMPASSHAPISQQPIADYTLYNIAAAQDGRRIGLLYNVEKSVGTLCEIFPSTWSASDRDADWEQYAANTASTGYDIRWLAGPLVDEGSTGANELDTSAGRIDPRIARVTASFAHGQIVEAEVANGTFVAVGEVPESPTSSGEPPVLRGYDANGNLVAESTADDTCYATPDGKIIKGDSTNNPGECKTATRWPQAN